MLNVPDNFFQLRKLYCFILSFSLFYPEKRDILEIN